MRSTKSIYQQPAMDKKGDATERDALTITKKLGFVVRYGINVLVL